jgi:hypothetical protein
LAQTPEGQQRHRQALTPTLSRKRAREASKGRTEIVLPAKACGLRERELETSKGRTEIVLPKACGLRQRELEILLPTTDCLSSKGRREILLPAKDCVLR